MDTVARTRVDRITTLHAENLNALRLTLDNAIEIGGLLAELKTETKHGEWLPWIKANLPFSERTARDYLRFYANREELKSANLADLTEARAYLSPPAFVCGYSRNNIDDGSEHEPAETDTETGALDSWTPTAMAGRILEFVHTAGYEAERACIALEWLLEEDRWKTLENNFSTVHDFLDTIDLHAISDAIDGRKKLSQSLKKTNPALGALWTVTS